MEECDLCKKKMHFADVRVTFSRNIEQAEFNVITQQEEITVVLSEELIRLCGQCGNRFNEANFVTLFLAASGKRPDLNN